MKSLVYFASSHTIRFVFVVLACAAFGAVAAAAPTDKPSANNTAKTTASAPAPTALEVVELPELTVRADRVLPPPELGWTYARFQNFEILSEVGERRTKDFIYYFGQYVNVMSAFMPQTEIRTNVPVKIILCDKVSTFAKFGDAFTSRAVSFFNNEQVAFVANLAVTDLLDYGNKDSDTGDLSQEEIFIMPDASAMGVEGGGVDWINGGGNSADTSFGSNITDPDGENISVDPKLAQNAAAAANSGSPLENSIKALQREYLKLFFNKMNPKPPVWFIAAVSRMFMEVSTGGKNVFLNSIGDTLKPLATGGLVPLGQVVGQEPLSPAFNAGHATNTAFGLMHYCLYSNYSKLQTAFAKFLLASSNGPVGEDVFKECFGMSYKKMELELQNYAGYSDYKEHRLKFDKVPAPENITVRAATEPEVGRIKGEALLLFQKTILAQGELITPYFRKNTDAELLGALGLVLLGTENSDRAKKILELSFKGGTKRLRVCLAVAENRLAVALDEARKKAEAEGKSPSSAKLTIEQLKSVLDPLSVALSQTPPAADTYVLMAKMWGASSLAPKQEHLKILADGYRMFPDNIDLAIDTAKMQISGGFFSDAALVIQRAYPMAKATEDKARLQALAARLTQAASANTAPQQPPQS